MFRSGNPALRKSVFNNNSVAVPADQQMTVTGTANKVGILFLLLLCGAAISWTNPSGLLIGIGLIGGFILAMVTIFKMEWARYTAPAYAFLEGLFLGAISLMFAQQYQGIVFNAVTLTLGIFAAMFIIYRTGVIEVTQKFRTGVVAATGGIFLVFLASFILRIFGIQLGLVYGTGFWAIIFSVVIIVVAALNLVLDFDLIERGAANGLPKYFEWYTAFGLVVTLIWLYIEILRLLSITQRR
jgi:uncharacterized YccA/Bax inhibitor family protein